MLDKLLTLQLDLNRFDASARRQVISLLNNAERELTAMMVGRELTTYNRARLTRFFKQTTEVINSYYSKAQGELFDDLNQIGDIVAKNTMQALESKLPATMEADLPSNNVMQAMLDEKNILGTPAQEWWSRTAGDTAFRFKQAVRQGMILGENNSSIVKRVTQVMDISRRNARTLVQTSINSVANHARQATFEANEDILKGYRWITALDSKVCDLCAARADKEWTTDQKPIGHNIAFQVPGVHMNDRCLLTPVTKSWKELGIKGIKEPRLGQRASEDGPVSGKTTFNDFLKGKNQAWQNEVLGKGRAELWRNGTITLEQLIDGTGNPLTLKQLKEKYMK